MDKKLKEFAKIEYGVKELRKTILGSYLED